MTKTLTLVHANEDTRTPSRLLRPAVVADRCGLSIPTIWRLRRVKKFPEPIRISPGAVAWLESEIETWIAERHEAAKR